MHHLNIKERNLAPAKNIWHFSKWKRSKRGNLSDAFWLTGERRPEVSDFQTIYGSFVISVDFCWWATAKGRARLRLDMLTNFSKAMDSCQKWIYSCFCKKQKSPVCLLLTMVYRFNERGVKSLYWRFSLLCGVGVLAESALSLRNIDNLFPFL